MAHVIDRNQGFIVGSTNIQIVPENDGGVSLLATDLTGRFARFTLASAEGRQATRDLNAYFARLVNGR